MKKIGVLIEILFVLSLLISLAQLLNNFALVPALEGNPEPGGIIFSAFYVLSSVFNYIWDKAGIAILGILILSGITIFINWIISRGKTTNKQ